MNEPKIIPEPGSLDEELAGQVAADEELARRGIDPNDIDIDGYEEEERRRVAELKRKAHEVVEGLEALGRIKYLLSMADYINAKHGRKRGRPSTKDAQRKALIAYEAAPSGKKTAAAMRFIKGKPESVRRQIAAMKAKDKREAEVLEKALAEYRAGT